MVRIYYTNISKSLPEVAYGSYLNKLPAELVEVNQQFRLPQDRLLNLFGKLLLIELLMDFKCSDVNLANLKYNQYGRPYFENGIEFNISHSGEFVVCAAAQRGRLGVDIEEIRSINFEPYYSTMSMNQWQIILNSENPKVTFFEYWAIKESVIKASSKGMSIPLQSIFITGSEVECMGNKWLTRKVHIDENYCCYLTTDFFPEEILVKSKDYTV